MIFLAEGTNRRWRTYDGFRSGKHFKGSDTGFVTGFWPVRKRRAVSERSVEINRRQPAVAPATMLLMQSYFMIETSHTCELWSCNSLRRRILNIMSRITQPVQPANPPGSSKNCSSTKGDAFEILRWEAGVEEAVNAQSFLQLDFIQGLRQLNGDFF